MRIAVALMVLGFSVAAQAQGPATAAQLLGKMQSVTVYPVIPVNLSEGSFVKTGYGLEFAFEVGEHRRKMSEAEITAHCAELKLPVCNTSSLKPDTVWVVVEGHGTAAQAIPNTALPNQTYRPELRPRTVLQWGFEIAVATQVSPMEFREPAEEWRLTGNVQEFPIVTFYGTYQEAHPASPYFGLRFIPAELKGARIAVGDSVATIEASDVGYGAAAGLVYVWQGINFYAELSWTKLAFDTPRWKLPGNIAEQPATFPTSIELDGYRWSFGAQISLAPPK